MRIALAQINTTVGDFRGNVAAMFEAYHRGCRERADLVVFPEQAIPGYPAEDLLARRDFLRHSLAALEQVARATRGQRTALVTGALLAASDPTGKPVHNSAVLIEDGKTLHAQHKALLPTYDVFDEARYFQPGQRHEVFPFRGRQLGLGICEDAWNDAEFWPERLYGHDPMEDMAAAGADLFVVVSASPFSLGRGEFRRRMLASQARRHGVELVYVNLVGGNTSLIFDGDSLVFDRAGRLIATGARFSEDLPVIDLATESVEVSAPAPSRAAEAFDALVLGTRDYLAKTGFTKAVLGLSGGIDSSLTAVVAAEAIGPQNVIGVSMPSRYSSEGSKTDARRLAENLGLQFHELPVERIFTASLETLEPVFGDLPADVTEENLQARGRGMLLMAISNKLGAILLTTGNKSELAVGYCTLYGDMSGGLAVISDVPKTLVYDICRYLNRHDEVIPQSVIDKPPSAELRPDQTDQDSLPPYEILDGILEAYVQENRGVDEIVERGFDRDTVIEVLKMVDRNEYKRKQAAPGLRITIKAFGTGRRFPIVQRYALGEPTRDAD